MQPSIVIQFDCYVHKVGTYQAAVVISVAQGMADNGGTNGEGVTQLKEVYSFTELHQGISIQRVAKQVTSRAAGWLLGNGYSGLVSFTGNTVEYITQLSGTGITRYKTEGSQLYLSPYSSWCGEQRAQVKGHTVSND